MTQRPQLRMGAREWGLLLGLSVLWGGSFFLVAVAVKELPPITIVTLRVGLLVIGAIVKVVQKKKAAADTSSPVTHMDERQRKAA